MPARIVRDSLLIMIAGSLFQYALSASSPMIVADLGLSRSSFGVIFFFFYVVSALASFVSGRLIDMSDARTIGVFGATVTLAGFIVAFRAQSLPALIVGASLAAMGNATAHPATASHIAANISGNGLSRAISIKQAGVPGSAVLIGFVVPPLTVVIGWRHSLIIFAVVVVLAAVRTSRWPRGTPHRRLVTPNHDSADSVRTRGLGRWLAYSFLIGAAIASTIAFLPLFATQSPSISVPMAGGLLAVWGLFGVIGRLVIVRAIRSRIASEGLLRITALVSAMAVVGLALLGLRGVIIFAMLTALLAMSSMSTNVILYFGVIDRYGPVCAGRLSGNLAFAQFAGSALGPPLFGLVADVTSGYLASWAFVAFCFIAAAMKVARPAPVD